MRSKGVATHLHIAFHTKQVGVGTFDGVAFGIIVHIIDQVLQFDIAVKDAVVETFLPQSGCVQAQFSAENVASTFETADDMAQVLRNAFMDKNDDVDVIGHHLMGKDLDCRAMMGDSGNGIAHSLSHRTEMH